MITTYSLLVFIFHIIFVLCTVQQKCVLLYMHWATVPDCRPEMTNNDPERVIKEIEVFLTQQNIALRVLIVLSVDWYSISLSPDIPNHLHCIHISFIRHKYFYKSVKSAYSHQGQNLDLDSQAVQRGSCYNLFWKSLHLKLFPSLVCPVSVQLFFFGFTIVLWNLHGKHMSWALYQILWHSMD